MFLRRSAALLVASAALCAVTAPAAVAAPASDDGLYGTGDPTYDGVWRQSLTLLAQDAARVVPSKKAVRWLTDQQCDDGSFPAYRARTEGDCGKKATPNTNATGIAVQALVALGGHDKAVHKAVGWLESVQNDDGGWGYTAGAPSDANSVGLVIGSLAVAGENPAKTTGKDGATPYDALLGFRLGCDAKPDARGAFAYQPDKHGKLAPNADATAAAVLGGLGSGVVVSPGSAPHAGPAAPSACGSDDEGGEVSPQRAAEGGAAYLTAVLTKNGHHLQSVMPGAKDQPDWSNTADAVVALAAGGHDKAADASVSWLEKHVGDWDKATSDPAALSQLVLAAYATGNDPHDFGGVDLVKRLNATGPAPQGTKPHPATGATAPHEEKDDSGDATVWIVSLIGAGLAAGIGVGLAMSARRRKEDS
jgi:hypothetical protein